jgi:hypothetical protein
MAVLDRDGLGIGSAEVVVPIMSGIQFLAANPDPGRSLP